MLKQEFAQELQDSLYVHRPLPLHRERSLEASFPQKKVLASRVLYGREEQAAKPQGAGLLSMEERDGVISATAALRADHWPEGAAPDGDYSNFGTAKVIFDLPCENWEGYNRLLFRVKPQILGARILHLNVAVENVGEYPLPDPYFREGATVFDLQNGEWNDCIWEFAAMPRDAITKLTFYVFCSGHDVAGGDTLTYDYTDITLERVENPEHERGWQNDAPGIRLSTVGYFPDGKKTAVAVTASDTFQLVDESGKAVYEGKVRTVDNARGHFQVLDFSDYTVQGRYFLRAGEVKSPVFEIAEDLCTETLWKVLNFFYCERCGTPVPGKHGTCHQDIVAHHNGVTMSFGGGWHDAGDVSQQAAQTGEVVQAMFENARRVKDKDRALYLRLMEEAQWGLDFVLRTRFGDGYRATSAGATRYTDNLIGNFDDVETRVHNHSYENFLFSGIEAYAATTLLGYDDALAASARKAAEEDFDFAVAKFAETGVEPAIMFEHTYNSGLSQYYAVIVWAASCLMEATGEEKYAKAAREYAEKLLACQEIREGNPALSGFFYRDESHKAIVHFNHQSRDHQFMQALAALCLTQPEAPEKPLWESAMLRFGRYLKAIAGNTAPYGMIPAGVHRLDEPEDKDTFPWLHLACTYENEKQNYIDQLSQGTRLDENHVLRNFPVWFSFRGNAAVLLSTGKAASILGRYFHDKELLEIAREQLYWMWGKNPFGQSLVYGVGADYCRQYAVLCGECVGEVPVGVETWGNEDVPYWPQNNNATFREVWVGAACRLLWVCADCTEEA